MPELPGCRGRRGRSAGTVDGSDSADAVVARLEQWTGGRAKAPGGASGTLVVAVDGAGGSGKTTLAARVARLVPACVTVHGDDFYRPMDDRARLLLDPQGGYQTYFDWQRLRTEVLQPLRAGRPAVFRRYNWDAGELGGTGTVAPGAVVLVEGVYVLRPELEGCYDLAVYVDTPREVCLRRLRERNQDPAGWVERWRAAEDYYIERFCPAERADIVVAGV